MSGKQTITIEVSNLTSEQAQRLTDFMRTMQYLGDVGASRHMKLSVDGDGDFRAKVKVNGEEPPFDRDRLKAFVPNY